MKKILCLISILILVFAVSCSKKKKSNDYEERVSKEISAEEGGKVESSDGKTSVDIPAGALDEDTTITMTIRSAEGYEGTEDMNVVGSIVEFEPSGKVFKKPIIITMPSTKNFDNKVVSAAVLHKTGEAWSYDGHGAIAVLHDGKDAAGDPIMTTAAGDPIMLNAAGDPIMQSTGEMLAAAGDPIMLAMDGGMSAAGDPIMQTAAGKQIGISAAGDPIMTSAAGDPIMMTTGHFSAYTFVIVGEGESAGKPDDDEPAEDDDEPVVEDDDEPAEDDDEPVAEDDDDPIDDVDVIPEPDPVYSKVLCTGSTRCSLDSGSFVDCPEEGEDYYGQDAQYANKKSCVPAKYTKILPDIAAESGYTQVVDEVTGLRWLVDKAETMSFESAKDFCSALDYGGFEDWRLPTPKEVMSIAVGDSWGHGVRGFYFPGYYYGGGDVWVRQELSEEAEIVWSFRLDNAEMSRIYDPVDILNYVLCVRGDEYGTVSAENYTSVEKNGEEMIKDSSTDLFWQKDSGTVENWKDALAYCENLNYAGHDDWRLPNRNELLTLVDYTKVPVTESFDPETESAASLFPGMTSAVFASSTPVLGYGGTYGYWGIDMSTGIAETSYEGGEVRCVRSDTVGYPEGMNMPYCDESGVAPCKDAVSGIIWSPTINVYDNSSSPDRETFARRCRESVFAGNRKWKSPTIDEVRTLATKCGEVKAGGECNISETCYDYSDDCYSEDVCTIDGGCESDLNDYGIFLSSTPSEDTNTWVIDLKSGIVSTSNFNGQDGVFRCVMDESIPDYTFPYTDPETGIVWSSMSDDELNWADMDVYCDALEEGGYTWRLPSMEELKTLVRYCPEGNCEPDISGKYSIFGDVSLLWSSEMYMSEHYLVLDFMYAAEKEDIYNAKVRCVKEGEQ